MTDDYLVEVRVVLLQEAGLKLCKLNEKATNGTRVSASAALQVQSQCSYCTVTTALNDEFVR